MLFCSGCWVDVRHLRGVGGRLAHPHHRQQLCKLLQEREEEGANSREEVKQHWSSLKRKYRESRTHHRHVNNVDVSRQ